MFATLIETVRIVDGRAPLWPLHLARLRRSALRLRVPVPDVNVPIGDGDAVMRLTLGEAGVMWEARAPGETRPLSLVTSPVGHRPYPDKTTERGPFDRALAEARERGADEPLLLVRGRVAEAARFAVVWERDGRLGTPPLALGVLPSVGLERLRQLLPGTIEEMEIGRAELRTLPFCLVNAARGVIGVARWDGEIVATPTFAEGASSTFWS